MVDDCLPETYLVEIIRRNGLGQTADDWHATVTRLPDFDDQLVYISRWRWILAWRTRRKALQRAFKYHDKRKRKLAEKDRYFR
jgi:hypothetical protein